MGRSRIPEAAPVGEPSPRQDLSTLGGRLRWVLHDAGLFPDTPAPENISPRQVVSLDGGADASTYLVRCPDRDVVVKLNDRGLEAEARALRAWAAIRTRVPEVLGVGRLPSTGSRPLRYLVLGALVNDDGDLVETATEYLARNPARARDVGRQLGAELQHMHEARCPTGFGNFADSPGAGRTYDSWNSYLEDFLVQHASYVKALGVAGCQVEKARAFIRRCGYVDEPRYLHGDVSIRNIAMRSYDPVSISLLDPNPLAGDPSWDIAPMTNNVEFSGRRHRADGGASDTLALDSDIVAGFWEFYPHVIAHSSLLTAQLVQAVLQAQHRQRASHFGDTDDLDVEVVHEFIRDVMDRMSE